LASLCAFFEVNIVHWVGGEGSFTSTTTEPDVKDPDNVALYRDEVMEALSAEFGLPDDAYNEE
jgi:hypothetical protein